MTVRETPSKPLILASASPRRAALLRRVGVEFEVRPVNADETLHPGESPAAAAERLAREKALAAAQLWPERVVLAADTVVSADGVGLGKPASAGKARAMLTRLSGCWHEVVTGVALSFPGREEPLAGVSTSRVLFSPLSEEEIESYVAGDEPWDKAGGYAIQGAAAWFVERLEGSPSNVVGLPLELVRRLFAAAGLGLPTLRGSAD